MSATKTVPESTDQGSDDPNILHIERPDNPNIAYCGYVRRSNRSYGYWEFPESRVCAMCLSYPGAWDYARGLA